MPRSDPSIFWPMFALAAWTLAVLLRVAFVRVSAARRGEVRPDQFRGAEPPDLAQAIALPNRNYMNLLEMPVLFYVGCLMAYVSGTATGLVVTLAWLYVLLRVVHTFVHLTWNNVVHRLAVFALGNGVLTVMWVLIGLALAAPTRG